MCWHKYCGSVPGRKQLSNCRSRYVLSCLWHCTGICLTIEKQCYFYPGAIFVTPGAILVFMSVLGYLVQIADVWMLNWSTITRQLECLYTAQQRARTGADTRYVDCHSLLASIRSERYVLTGSSVIHCSLCVLPLLGFHTSWPRVSDTCTIAQCIIIVEIHVEENWRSFRRHSRSTCFSGNRRSVKQFSLV